MTGFMPTASCVSIGSLPQKNSRGLAPARKETNMEEKENTQHIDIPWFKRWEEKDTTPPDPDFVARLEELEYK